jgi:hypothetical protein
MIAVTTPLPTACLQSQIGHCHHLQGQGVAQIVGVVALSVVVLSEPARTALNGTLVARPVRRPWPAWRLPKLANRR